MTAIKPNTDDANSMNIMMTTYQEERDRTYWSIHTARIVKPDTFLYGTTDRAAATVHYLDLALSILPS